MDLVYGIKRYQSLKPAARAATATGAANDNAGVYAGSQRAVTWNIGLWTDGSHLLSIQESADGSTWNDVAAVDLNAYNYDDSLNPINLLDVNGKYTVSSVSTDELILVIHYLGDKEFLRTVQTVTGATTGCVTSSTIEATGLRIDGGPNPGRNSNAW